MKIKLKNLGTVNKNIVIITKNNGKVIELWFSYETVVAFRSPKGFKCRQNEWSTTTGRFLNELCPNHKERIEGREFEKELEKLLK